jgi:hypothetical protein
MSTRGFLTFVADGVEKTTYNHCDSYPSALGVDVLSWARKADLNAATTAIRNLRVVAPDSSPTLDDIERLRPYARPDVASRSLDDWYVLLRETQGDPAAMLAAGVILDASDFPADSLFAEYGYVVDVDAGTFEVYRGFQHEPHDKGRFAGREPKTGAAGTYYPVAMLASFPLASLPSDDDFMATVEPEEAQR